MESILRLTVPHFSPPLTHSPLHPILQPSSTPCMTYHDKHSGILLTAALVDIFTAGNSWSISCKESLTKQEKWSSFLSFRISHAFIF